MSLAHDPNNHELVRHTPKQGRDFPIYLLSNEQTSLHEMHLFARDLKEELVKPERSIIGAPLVFKGAREAQFVSIDTMVRCQAWDMLLFVFKPSKGTLPLGLSKDKRTYNFPNVKIKHAAPMHPYRSLPSTSRGPGQTQEFVESRERGKHPWVQAKIGIKANGIVLITILQQDREYGILNLCNPKTSKKRRNICEVIRESDKLRKEILRLDLTDIESIRCRLVGLCLFLSCMRYSELTCPRRREYCIIFERHKKHGLMKGYTDKKQEVGGFDLSYRCQNLGTNVEFRLKRCEGNICQKQSAQVVEQLLHILKDPRFEHKGHEIITIHERGSVARHILTHSGVEGLNLPGNKFPFLLHNYVPCL
ncbi:hypothetical protein VNO77_03268 [Canavalia gladiata]|uniref:Uncharacterized protein n=1 Tax=Canavalia gladiata TaxID=3824 RepID=A0AAN9R3P8_CANGL